MLIVAQACDDTQYCGKKLKSPHKPKVPGTPEEWIQHMRRNCPHRIFEENHVLAHGSGAGAALNFVKNHPRRLSADVTSVVEGKTGYRYNRETDRCENTDPVTIHIVEQTENHGLMSYTYGHDCWFTHSTHEHGHMFHAETHCDRPVLYFGKPIKIGKQRFNGFRRKLFSP